MPRDFGTSAFRAGGLISMRVPELKGIREGGRFTSEGLNEMVSRNREFAVSLQADVVRNIQASITRPGASTGRLARVTASPENAQYSTWNIGVGDERFLNGSIAKYWRTFEEGSAGLWSRPFIGTQLMPKGGTPPYPVAHGAIPGIRTTTKHLRWMDGKKYVVKHEIAPRGAYAAAIRSANPRRFAFQSATQLLTDVWRGYWR